MNFDSLDGKPTKGKRDTRWDSKVARSRIKNALRSDDENRLDSVIQRNKAVRGWLTWWGINSAALIRHLNSKIGQQYDAVYSDLCKNFTKKQHRYLLDQSLQWIIVNDDQRLWDDDFYVNHAGTLCKTKKIPRYRYRYNKEETPLLTKGRFIKIDNIWYEVILSDNCDSIVDTYLFLCWFERRIQKRLFEKSRFDFHTAFLRRAELDEKVTKIINHHFGGKFPVKILQLNKRAIRKNGLV